MSARSQCGTMQLQMFLKQALLGSPQSEVASSHFLLAELEGNLIAQTSSASCSHCDISSRLEKLSQIGEGHSMVRYKALDQTSIPLYDIPFRQAIGATCILDTRKTNLNLLLSKCLVDMAAPRRCSNMSSVNHQLPCQRLRSLSDKHSKRSIALRGYEFQRPGRSASIATARECRPGTRIDKNSEMIICCTAP
jgi:hypothetical protein